MLLDEALAAEKRKAAELDDAQNGLGLPCGLDDDDEPGAKRRDCRSCLNSPLFDDQTIEQAVCDAQAAAQVAREAVPAAGPVLPTIPQDLPVPAGPPCVTPCVAAADVVVGDVAVAAVFGDSDIVAAGVAAHDVYC